MTLDLDTLVKLASLGLSVGAIIFSYFATRKKDVEERFEKGRLIFAEHEARITALETAQNNMPKNTDLHRLELTLSEIGGDMKAVRATMRGMSESMARTEAIVNRHETHLLDGGKS
ncbi:DUF2730 family protein [Thalassobius sp. I31.1]|uniref:DUF2730 family protein n=1 Tax=Thalassobius sp. I31.1 TaxID=2109912 RepID=UPI001300BBFF|nr:DUF2730 family protein [Thalassobius sp. I31.1]